VPTAKTVVIPFTKIAREEFGTELVALGALGWLSKNISQESLEKAVISRVPPGTKELNLKALQARVKAAESYDLKKLPQTSGGKGRVAVSRRLRASDIRLREGCSFLDPHRRLRGGNAYGSPLLKYLCP